MIQIRFATIKDKENIRSFLKNHWSEKSILVTSEKIFDFQYVDGDHCGFVLAIDDDTQEIFGLKGFFPFNSKEKPDVAAALAIVLQGVRPMLGMEIQRFLEKNSNCRWLCSTGINPNTSVRVYKLFKNQYVVDKLRQYYRLSDLDTYQVAKIDKKTILPVTASEYEFEQLDTIEELVSKFNLSAFEQHKPYKDARYLNHRYYCHPVYKYQVLGIRHKEDKDHVDSILIAREVSCNGTKVLRIVDFIGNQEDIGKIGMALDDLMNANGYEYVDFYCYGIAHEHLINAGFVHRDSEDQNIIPNYFEPFEQRNVDIYFFCTGDEDAVICKADGDQDRPNIIPEDLC